jgi:hypothetical protein
MAQGNQGSSQPLLSRFWLLQGPSRSFLFQITWKVVKIFNAAFISGIPASRAGGISQQLRIDG